MMTGLRTVLSEWEIRIVVLLSLLAHILLTVFVSIRRRQRSGVATLVLWSAYQFADWAAPFALSKLPFGRTLLEQQLVALWVPFLISHLGGLDNLTAFSFEDNKLSWRKVVSTLLHMLGTLSAVFKQVNIGGGNGALLGASLVMVVLAAAKYIEKALALRVADFGTIRKATMKRKKHSFRIQPYGYVQLDDEQALLVAHSLLDISPRVPLLTVSRTRRGNSRMIKI